MERINGFKRFLVLRIAAKRAATNEDFARFAAIYDTMTKEAVAADMDCRAPAGLVMTMKGETR